MSNEKKSILQPKNDVVFKALFSRGKPKLNEMNLTIEQIAKAVELNEEDVKAILNEKK